MGVVTRMPDRRPSQAEVDCGSSGAEAFADEILHVYRNATAWDELSSNAARFARSGGDGKGVCPTGLLDDVTSFWSKMQHTVCGVT